MSHALNVIETFSKLGEEFDSLTSRRAILESAKRTASARLKQEITSCQSSNPWFIPEFVSLSLKAWASALEKSKLEQWLALYPVQDFDPGKPLRVAVIMAGNIPLVGLHDLLCVLASGHRAIVKMSSQDDRLMRTVMDLLLEINPEISSRIEVHNSLLKEFDAVIATGSNNTSRYFEFYFGKYPNIIRKNRNSVALISGRETEPDMMGLSLDILSYFGLGCRNISKIYCPEGYDLNRLFSGMQDFHFIADQSKYMNNYDYQKSIFIINGIRFSDNGFLLIRKDKSINSPVSVVHYEEYNDLKTLMDEIATEKDSIQCVISAGQGIPGACPPGQAQFPELWDYADGIDTMQFLSGLK